jgi:hypothetical protein
LANARIIFAEMCRKKIDAMKERERTRTINGSLLFRAVLVSKNYSRNKRVISCSKEGREEYNITGAEAKWRKKIGQRQILTLSTQANHPYKASTWCSMTRPLQPHDSSWALLLVWRGHPHADYFQSIRNNKANEFKSIANMAGSTTR